MYCHLLKFTCLLSFSIFLENNVYLIFLLNFGLINVADDTTIPIRQLTDDTQGNFQVFSVGNVVFYR